MSFFSVARVAPFAYFPPQEEQRIIEQFGPQQTSEIGIPLGSEIVNNHQVGLTHKNVPFILK
jgi:hypothetical protein